MWDLEQIADDFRLGLSSTGTHPKPLVEVWGTDMEILSGVK